jgi:hypothetical protein
MNKEEYAQHVNFSKLMKKSVGRLIRIVGGLETAIGTWIQIESDLCLVLQHRDSIPSEGICFTMSAANNQKYEVVNLLVDGKPRWVVVAEEDIELVA